MPDDNPWDVLGLPPSSDEERVRQAYLRLARENHPDLFRGDPSRCHAQEERMKTINRAYAQITSGKARPHWLPPPPQAPLCPEHGQAADKICHACGERLCPLCPGYSTGACARHAPQPPQRRGPPRFMREWGWLAALLAAGRLMRWPLPVFLCIILGYLALLGVVQLRRIRYFGFMVWLFLPYSLVLAGLYSLYTALRPPARPTYRRTPGP